MTIHTKLSKRLINPTTIIPSIFLFLTVISALTLTKSPSSTKVSATEDRKSALASVTVPDTCYMSSTSTTHTGTASGGTYTENFGGESTVTVTCNDRNGYSVYAVGYSNDIEGTNGLIGTSTGSVIPSGTSTSTNVSNWAMKLTPGTGSFAPTILNGYNNYNLVPTTATKVATLTSDINVSNSSQFKTSYAVAVAPTQAADTYTGKVKYTVVHPNYSNADGTLESYPVTLSFGANASSIVIDGITYTSSSSTPNLTHGTHTISGTYPSGYEFDSWSAIGNITIADSSSASTTVNVTGTGTLTLTGQLPLSTITFKTNDASSIVFNGVEYSNNQTVRIANGTYWIYGNYATKYAFKSWANTAGSFANSSYQVTQYTVVDDATITLTGQSVTTTIQSITSSTCTTTTKPVYDSRDNEVYWIQQLADGKCWMLDNLRLGGASTISLTSSSTNTNTSWTLPKSGTVCFATGSCTGTDGSTSGTGYTVPAINTAYKDTIPKSGSNLTVYGPGTGKIGVYYNYCAASAGNICVDSNSNNGSADRDICPKGWKLPTTGSSNNSAGSYYYLYNTSYSANAANFRNAFSTPLSGYFSKGSAGNQGTDGRFWSATRNSSTYMYHLYVDSGNVNPTYYGRNRQLGYSVRCILK